MSRLRFWLRRLLSPWRHQRLSDEISEELQFHIDLQTEVNMHRGMSPDEARREARLHFGNLGKIREEGYEVRGTAWVESIATDLRYAARILLKNKGFALVVVVTLALGVGVNTAIFSVINGIILRPLPYKQPDQIVILRQQFSKTDVAVTMFSVPEMNDYHQQNNTLSEMVEYFNDQLVLQDQGRTERVRTGVVSHDFFDLFGVSPVLGRSFLSSDSRSGATPVVLLSYEYWKRAYNSNASVIGETLKLNDIVYTVIGVLPAVPQYPDENDVYITSSSSPFRMWPARIGDRNRRFARVFARLKPGVTAQQASNDVEVIATRLQQQYPASYPSGSGFRASAVPFAAELTSKARPTMWLLLGAAGFVLLIACANVANFMLARLSQREQELSLRMALGASKGRLFRQLLTENLLLGFLAAGFGLSLAVGSHRLLVNFAAKLTPRAREISIDIPVLLFALLSAVLISLITGSVLGLSLRRSAYELKTTSRQSSAGVGQKRIRNGLIVAQVAFSLTLLIGAGLMLRSFFNLQRVDTGFVGDRVLTMHLDFTESTYTSPNANFSLELSQGRAILEKVESMPGVSSAAISSSFPFDPNSIALGLNNLAMYTSRIQIESKPVPPGQVVPLVPYNLVSADYFKALQIPLIQGRTFLPTDKQGSPDVVVVNQAFAEHRLSPDDAIGKRLSWDGGKTWLTIVGIVGNTREFSLNEKISDEVYYPAAQTPGTIASLLVRTSVDSKTMTNLIRKAVGEASSGTAASYVETLEEARDDTLGSSRTITSLLGLFAVLALIVAASGIGGILALSISQRFKEIGIRLALGAAPSDVMFMIVRQGMVLVAIGLVCGLILSFAMIGSIKPFLFGVGATDPFTLAGVCVLLVVTGLLSCYIPARRSTKIDPMVALRNE